MIHHHTEGEEKTVFAVLEQRCPAVAAGYLHDHVAERARLANIEKAARAGDLAAVRRGASQLVAHVELHIQKEEELIVPLMEKHFTIPEIGEHVGKMMASFTPEDLKALLPWMIVRLSPQQRIAYLQVVKGAMPPDRFQGMCGIIRGGIPAEDWSAIAAGVPGIA
jgi:hypothetical protein